MCLLYSITALLLFWSTINVNILKVLRVAWILSKNLWIVEFTGTLFVRPMCQMHDLHQSIYGVFLLMPCYLTRKWIWFNLWIGNNCIHRAVKTTLVLEKTSKHLIKRIQNKSTLKICYSYFQHLCQGYFCQMYFSFCSFVAFACIGDIDISSQYLHRLLHQLQQGCCRAI